MIKGQSKSIIHTDITTLGDELMQFISTTNADAGVFRRNHNILLAKEVGGNGTGGKKMTLPFPQILHSDDQDCIIVRSYVYSSSTNNEVFIVAQRYVKLLVSDKETHIAFWTIYEDEVPSSNNNNNNNNNNNYEFFSTNKIK